MSEVHPELPITGLSLIEKAREISERIHHDFESPKTPFTRRDFLKLAGAGVVAVVAAGGLWGLIKSSKAENPSITPEEVKTRFHLRFLGAAEVSWADNELRELSAILSGLPVSFYDDASITLTLPLYTEGGHYAQNGDEVSICRGAIPFIPLDTKLMVYEVVHELVHRRLINTRHPEYNYDTDVAIGQPPKTRMSEGTDTMLMTTRRSLIAASQATLQNGVYVPGIKDQWFPFVQENYKSNLLGEWVAYLGANEYFADSNRFRQEYGEEMAVFMNKLFEGRDYKDGVVIG